MSNIENHGTLLNIEKEQVMAIVFITGSTDGLGRAAAQSLLDDGALATRQAALLPSRLQFQPAHEIAFADRRALVPDNVIRCCRVKKEVGQRERH